VPFIDGRVGEDAARLPAPWPGAVVGPAARGHPGATMGSLSRRRFLALATLAAGCRARARRADGEPEVDVAVVGGGLAGLAAAHVLLAAGRSVAVLEARARVGGRVHTLREPFAHGQHAEAGAIFVPGSHTLTRRYLDECGLALGPAFDDGFRMGVFLRERLLVGGRFEEPPVELRDDERGLGRRGLMGRYVLPVLEEFGEDVEDFDDDTDSEPARRLDALSMADLLRERGASEGAVELLGVGYMAVLGDGIEHTSALQVLRDLASGGLDTQRIVGGSERLPEAMAEPLGPLVRRASEVLGLEESATGVRLSLRVGGEPGTLCARRAVVTLPTTVLRTLALPPGLSRAKRRALDELDSTSVVRTYLQCARRSWRPLASVDVDRPALQLMDATGGQPGEAGILEGYASGAEARALDRLDEAGRRAHLRTQARRVFPAAELEELAGTSYSWDSDPFARGGYAWFRPGQLSAHLSALRAPEGRLHFAGEHLSAFSGWMQGALESGERAAREADEALRST
jgi:monoamine oxidase